MVSLLAVHGQYIIIIICHIHDVDLYKEISICTHEIIVVLYFKDRGTVVCSSNN